MDWARAIERNRDALSAILAALFALLGLQEGGSVGRIERSIHRAVLRVLISAESAVRRLVVIAARGLVAKPVALRPSPKGLAIRREGGGAMAFQLFDPRQRSRPWWSSIRIPDHKVPRIWVPFDERPPGTLVFRPEDFGKTEPPPKDDSVDAMRLSRRLQALKLALADLPRQAKRLVRLRARRESVPSLRLKSPMRPGRPPGFRKKPSHDVDHVLVECPALARDSERPDTS
jgi:hypothetical protein